MAQSIPSVASPRAFVGQLFFFFFFIQKPLDGALKKCANATPRDNPKFAFSSK